MASDPSKRPANGSIDQPRVKRSRFDTTAPAAASNGAAVVPSAAADRAAALEKAQKVLLLGSDIKSKLAALKVTESLILWPIILACNTSASGSQSVLSREAFWPAIPSQIPWRSDQVRRLTLKRFAA